MQQLLFVFGTRPEAIKLAPVVLAARAHGAFQVSVCVTAQHREMLDSVLAFFDIQPEFDLNLMKPGQTLSDVTSGVLHGLAPVLEQVRPDWVLVQGDTTTAFVAGLAAFYARVPVAHVEAGLRTGNIYEPWPEEMNRKLLGALASWHFAPTGPARANLLREGIDDRRVRVTGNTGIDALYLVRERLRADADCQAQVHAALASQTLERFLSPQRAYVLVTAHRRESFGPGFDAICGAIGDLCERFADVDFVFPVHPNPNVRGAVERLLVPRKLPNLTLCQPLDYLPFVALMIGAAVVLTDSGGVQEEAPSLGKPVVVMRDLTERMEGRASGLVHLVGPHRDRIVQSVSRLLLEPPQTGEGGNFYGDGHASARILGALAQTGALTAQTARTQAPGEGALAVDLAAAAAHPLAQAGRPDASPTHALAAPAFADGRDLLAKPGDIPANDSGIAAEGGGVVDRDNGRPANDGDINVHESEAAPHLTQAFRGAAAPVPGRVPTGGPRA